MLILPTLQRLKKVIIKFIDFKRYVEILMEKKLEAFEKCKAFSPNMS